MTFKTCETELHLVSLQSVITTINPGGRISAKSRLFIFVNGTVYVPSSLRLYTACVCTYTTDETAMKYHFVVM